MTSAVLPTYARTDFAFERGEGVRLWTDTGEEYLDFGAGIAVNSLGHSHPRLVEALKAQAEKLWHTSNLYRIPGQEELAKKLTDATFADLVFFGNSGAEAMECCIKTARKYHSEKGNPERYRIITYDGAFHGRTLATIAAGGQEKHLAGFGPVVEGFDKVPFADEEATKQAITDETAGILIEPVQGEGGVCPAQMDYLAAVRKLCDETGTLLIFDEIQTGMGRTGTLFAHESYGVTPDIMTLAKALGNGLPIGAMLATEEVAKAFSPGSHGSTFGGSPLAASAALAVCRELTEGGVIESGKKMGAYFREKLSGLVQRHDSASSVRGLGLLLGLKLSFEGAKMVESCLAEGFVINCVQGDILRFVPPLTIGEKEIDALIDCLDRLLPTQG